MMKWFCFWCGFGCGFQFRSTSVENVQFVIHFVQWFSMRLESFNIFRQLFQLLCAIMFDNLWLGCLGSLSYLELTSSILVMNFRLTLFPRCHHFRTFSAFCSHLSFFISVRLKRLVCFLFSLSFCLFSFTFCFSFFSIFGQLKSVIQVVHLIWMFARRTNIFSTLVSFLLL